MLSTSTIFNANRVVPDPNVSEEAKEHAREVLREHGASETRQVSEPVDPEELHDVRVNAGYKAALHSASSRSSDFHST
jgi:hypothetical protein